MDLKFKIQGMHCQSCATLIEEELKDFPGVEEVNVNYNSNKASVVYDEKIASQNGIFQLIERLGNYNVVKEEGGCNPIPKGSR